jgi:cell division protein FtsB
MVFVIWMLFFDQNNMMRQHKLTLELNEAKQKEQYYKNEIKNDSLEVLQLQTDLKAVEKLGREKYNMKKDDETIFLIVREDEKKETEVQK